MLMEVVDWHSVKFGKKVKLQATSKDGDENDDSTAMNAPLFSIRTSSFLHKIYTLQRQPSKLSTASLVQVLRVLENPPPKKTPTAAKRTYHHEFFLSIFSQQQLPWRSKPFP